MPHQTELTIVTADAQPIIRAGIRQVLADTPGCAVIGEASNCVEALELCERLCPALLIYDVAMPGGLTLLAHLRDRRLPTRALIVTERAERALLDHALRSGVAGYVLKQISAFDLIQAVRGAASGLRILAPGVSALLDRQGNPEFATEELSVREQAVLELLLSGLSNSAIAAKLHVSRSTVKFHLCNIYDKLDVRSRAETIAVCYQRPRVLTQLLETVPGKAHALGA